MSISMTRHAVARAQHRAIPAAAIEMLLNFGSDRRCRGADSYYFDHAARQRAAAAVDSAVMRQCERFLNVYAVVGDDGALITVAWRNCRLRNA